MTDVVTILIEQPTTTVVVEPIEVSIQPVQFESVNVAVQPINDVQLTVTNEQINITVQPPAEVSITPTVMDTVPIVLETGAPGPQGADGAKGADGAAGPVGPPGINGFATVYQTPPLTLQQVTNGYVVLPVTPDDPTKVLCTPIHGTPQRYGPDFVVQNGNQLSWLGLGMATFVQVNDVLLITY